MLVLFVKGYYVKIMANVELRREIFTTVIQHELEKWLPSVTVKACNWTLSLWKLARKEYVSQSGIRSADVPFLVPLSPTQIVSPVHPSWVDDGGVILGGPSPSPPPSI